MRKLLWVAMLGWMMAQSLAHADAPLPLRAEQAQRCIRLVLAEDDRLGRLRNHAPETVPIDAAIEAYLRGLAQLDMSACPTAFVEAFKRHRAAWQETLGLLSRHAALRGEMHDVFDRIRESPDGAALRSLEARVWSTWAEVEASVATP